MLGVEATPSAHARIVSRHQRPSWTPGPLAAIHDTWKCLEMHRIPGNQCRMNARRVNERRAVSLSAINHKRPVRGRSIALNITHLFSPAISKCHLRGVNLTFCWQKMPNISPVPVVMISIMILVNQLNEMDGKLMTFRESR